MKNITLTISSIIDYIRNIFCSSSFFFNDTATTEIYTLSLHDALPISSDAFSLNKDWLTINAVHANLGLENPHFVFGLVLRFALQLVVDQKYGHNPAVFGQAHAPLQHH